MRVLAADQGSPTLTQEVPLEIDVTDVNDHRPAFSQRHYYVVAPEQKSAHALLHLTVSILHPRAQFLTLIIPFTELCSATMWTPPLESTHQELSFEWSHL